VRDTLDVEAELACKSGAYRGKVVDMSMSSISAEIGVNLPPQGCMVRLSYDNTVVNAKGRIVRSTDGVVVVELEDSDPEMTDFIGRVYADVFLLNQRGG